MYILIYIFPCYPKVTYVCIMLKTIIMLCLFMYVVGGDFDCEAMCDYLFKNVFSLEELPCDKIKHKLIDTGVITYEQKRLMNNQIEKLGQAVFKNIQEDLYHKNPKKFKVFLQIMEKSGVPLLEDAAKKLGE